MMKICSMSALGGLMIVWTVGCAREMPTAPSVVSDSISGARTAEVTASSTPVVTLEPDLTASPAQVSVAAGNTVLVANQSARPVLMRSYN